VSLKKSKAVVPDTTSYEKQLSAKEVDSVKKLPQRKIKIKNREIVVEVADDDEERARGLMERIELGANEGMLFVFPEEQRLSFWMKNTLINLSIAYINAEGKIVDIQEMKKEPTGVLTYKTYPTVHKAKYALEMKESWFESSGIKVGDAVVGLP